MVARQILQEQQIHPAIRQMVSSHFRDTVEEVKNATDKHRVVIVGMSGNPFVSKARQILHDRNISYKYLEYGSYFSQWRLRNSLKMWTGWPTFPMIFVDGVLIGGYQDLQSLINSADLIGQLATERRYD
jgi:glutaredoxin-related protein